MPRQIITPIPSRENGYQQSGKTSRRILTLNTRRIDSVDAGGVCSIYNAVKVGCCHALTAETESANQDIHQSVDRDHNEKTDDAPEYYLTVFFSVFAFYFVKLNAPQTIHNTVIAIMTTE